jgi:hypothetical protein
MKKFALLFVCFVFSVPVLALEGFDVYPGKLAADPMEIDKRKPIEVLFSSPDSEQRNMVDVAHPLLSKLIQTSLREEGYVVVDENNPAKARMIINAIITINNREGMMFEDFFSGETFNNLTLPERGYVYTSDSVFRVIGNITHQAGYVAAPFAILSLAMLPLDIIASKIQTTRQRSRFSDPIKPCDDCAKPFSVRFLVSVRLDEFNQEKQSWETLYRQNEIKGIGDVNAVPLLDILKTSLLAGFSGLSHPVSFNFPEEAMKAAVLTPETQLHKVGLPEEASAQPVSTSEPQPAIEAAPAGQ